ncbi:MAG: hypothetical protein ACKV2T_12315 [Kofleriaceae bacterium]
MRPNLLVAVLASSTLSSVAVADRTTTVNVGGMFGGAEDLDGVDNYYERPTMYPAGGPRITLGFENPPVAMPPQSGYSVAGAFVPELTAGALMSEKRGDLFLGLGGRAELQLGQNKQGLLKVSARAAFYVAGRIVIIGKEQDTAGDFAVGSYFYIKGRTRIGGEVNVMVREAPMSFPTEEQMAVLASAYVGWAM